MGRKDTYLTPSEQHQPAIVESHSWHTFGGLTKPKTAMKIRFVGLPPWGLDGYDKGTDAVNRYRCVGSSDARWRGVEVVLRQNGGLSRTG